MANKKFCFFVSTSRHNKEVLVFRQSKVLKENGYVVEYVVNDNEEGMEVDGVHISSTGYTSKGYLSRIFIAPFFILRKLLKLDADIYQTCSVDQILICLLLKLRGKKIIFHMREAHPYTFLRKSGKNLWWSRIIVAIMATFMKYSLRYFDAVFVVTQDIYDYVNKWGITKLYLQGNYPFINKEYTLPYEEYIKRENCIIYFGSIYNNSCQEAMLDALAGIQSVKYLIAGKFWNNISYQKKLEAHSKWKEVEFVDGFDINELPSLLKKATMSNVLRDFVNSETPNGSLGIIKIFESMEAALPLICSDVPVYRDMMREYKCGLLVDPNNSVQIKRAVEYLITHKEEAWKMGQEGRRAVVEKYSWDAVSKEYCSIIDNF